MPRLCPRCNNSVNDEPRCPQCGYRMRGLGRRGESARSADDAAPSWQQTPWGKTIIGLVVAQGLWYTLIMLARTIVSATGNDVAAWMSSLAGLLLMQVMQLVSLLVGGMLAGAGQRRGALYGTIVGVYNAILFVVFYIAFLKNEMAAEALFAMLLLQVVFGTLGGFLGVQIWKPIQGLASLPDGDAKAGIAELLERTAKQQKPPLLAGPVNWVRVLPGAIVAVVGTLGAPSIFRAILALNPDGGGPDTQTQVKFLTWEISALAMFFGGAIGGSNSFNGIKQGLFVGIIASVALIGGMVYQGDSRTDTASWLFTYFGIEQTGLIQRVVFTVMAVMPLSISGGWFGSQLLPPLIMPPRRKGMLSGIA
jgi:hypothetical protein